MIHVKCVEIVLNIFFYFWENTLRNIKKGAIPMQLDYFIDYNKDKFYDVPQIEQKPHRQTSIKKILLCFTVLGLAIYGIFFNIKANNNAQILQNQYKRTLTDMTDYVSHAENYLFKAMAAGTPEMLSNMLDGVTVCAHEAESCLSALPLDQHSIETISEYLVQLGDISGVWSHRAQNAGKLSKNEYEMLAHLSGYAQDLSGIMMTLNENLEQNSYNWEKLSKKTTNRLEKPFTDFSPMMYEGKYSSSLANSRSTNLQANQLTKKECENIAVRTFSDCLNSSAKITTKATSENVKNNIQTYCFSLESENGATASIDIDKSSGKIYSMIINRDISEVNLSAEQGLKAGKAFLQSIGIDNMKSIEYFEDKNTITASYVYEKDGIICYPDMVKVKISLDNGAALAFEGHNFCESHSNDIKIDKALVSLDEAKKALSPNFVLEGSQEALARSEYGSVYHAYEFSGRVEGRPVLIYIDAKTGMERDIVIIDENDNRSLRI